jgi:hypothetical protein
LWLVLLGACTQTFHLAGKDVPVVVERYRAEGRVTLKARSWHEIMDSNEPKLRVHERACVNDPCDIPEVPLAEVRTDDKNRILTVPGHAPLRYDAIESADLVIYPMKRAMP